MGFILFTQMNIRFSAESLVDEDATQHLILIYFILCVYSPFSYEMLFTHKFVFLGNFPHRRTRTRTHS